MNNSSLQYTLPKILGSGTPGIGNYKHVDILLFQDQYQFVHDVVKEYILQNETYSNFTNGWI